jgi:S-layer homology domain
MRKKQNLLLLFTALLSTSLLATPGAQDARATSASGEKPSQSTALFEAPNAWNTPYPISTREGYHNFGSIAASPIDGSADVVWSFVDDGDNGQVILSGNSSLSGAFTDYPQANGQANLFDGAPVAHDNLGRTHFLYWRWPSADDYCNYYALVDANHNVLTNEPIPGACDTATPRKRMTIAVDGNLTVHVALARDNVAGSLNYWQRANSGVWTVVGEPVSMQCAPTDPSIGVTNGGTVMVGWKDCGGSGAGSDILMALRNGPGSWSVDNISSACCASCPNQSNAYQPDLYAAPDGGIRVTWADGRCPGTEDTDIYYREWAPGTGWSGQPVVRVAANSGKSYNPTMAVDASGEAHIVWGDDTNSPFAYYRIFYSHGRGTTFTAPEIPFDSWAGNSWQRDPSVDFAFDAVHLSFASVILSPEKNNFYSYQQTTLPPPCASERFHDVCPGAYYYEPVIRLNDAGVISGYNGSPPCPNSMWVPCFLPGNNATRAQVSKIVVLGANLPINTSGGPHFSDVAPGSTFYNYIETLYNAGIVSGYGDGTFRPNNNVTRGQLSKMAVLAFGFNEPVSGQTFQDVAPGSTFYDYVQRLAGRGIISGYACGGAGEPCILPGNRPYFRPNNNVTRGQIAKIIDACRSEP